MTVKTTWGGVTVIVSAGGPGTVVVEAAGVSAVTVTGPGVGGVTVITVIVSTDTELQPSGLKVHFHL